MKTLADYLIFAEEHPDLFYNPPQGGFTILRDEEDIRRVEAEMAQKLQKKGMPAEWARVGIVFEDRYGFILRDAVVFPGGATGTYIRFISRMPGTVGIVVLPVYQRQILVARRFRHATRTWHWEIPLGTAFEALNRGATLEEQVREVLMRDIEAVPSRLVSLGSIDSGPAMAADTGELFFAELESYGRANINEGITELLCIPLDEFERMIRDNQITDGFTIAAYIRARIRNLLEDNH